MQQKFFLLSSYNNKDNNMQKFSFHTHTFGFDGKNTEEEMLSQAVSLGWEKIGFSNHFIVHHNIENAPMYQYAKKGGYNSIYSSSFDEAIAKFEEHYKKIDELRESSSIKILKGMEVDYFADDEWYEGFIKAINHLKPDYLIGSAHFIEQDGILYNSHDVKNAPLLEQKKLLHRYWQNERATASSGLFNILAHLDLMKKVGLGQEDEWLEDEAKTISVIKKSGAIVELNTSFYKKGNEPYPSKRIIDMLAKEHVPVIISDDAHHISQLGNYFSDAEELISSHRLKKALSNERQNNIFMLSNSNDNR